MLQRRPHERGEERMGIPRPRPELWVELSGHEVRMIRDFDDLDQLLLGPDPRDAQAVLLQFLEVVVVDLVAVPVTLVYDRLGVDAGRRATLGEDDGIEPESHGAALVGDAALFGQEVDDRMRRGRIELRGVGPAEPTDVAGVFDDRALHT